MKSNFLSLLLNGICFCIFLYGFNAHAQDKLSRRVVEADSIDLSISDQSMHAPSVAENCSKMESADPVFLKCGELSLFSGVEGSKQPQDYGVNANLGGRFAISMSAPLIFERRIGWQLGTAIQHTDNAVRVNELIGESTDRFQSFTTGGLFQRLDSGLAWGAVYDFLHQDSYDTIHAGQARLTLSQQWGMRDWIGIRSSIATHGHDAEFLGNQIHLKPLSQGGLFWRHLWQSSAQSTLLLGISDGHSEDNAVTGPSPRTQGDFVLGLDIFMPLNRRLAVYGESNLTSPADTGTVDAFLGLQWFPRGDAYRSRMGSFSPIHGVAGSTSMPLDLRP